MPSSLSSFYRFFGSMLLKQSAIFVNDGGSVKKDVFDKFCSFVVDTRYRLQLRLLCWFMGNRVVEALFLDDSK
jgi:hypothetical protein